MKAMRFILKRSLRFSPRTVVPAVICVVITAVVMIFHTDIGEEDYIWCKAAIRFGTLIFTEFTAAFFTADIAGNRIMRSSPIAGELYTKALPLYCAALPLSVSAVTNTAYILFCVIRGLDSANIADMMILSAGADLFCSVITALCLSFRYGFIFLCWSGLLILPLNLIPAAEEICTNGFSQPIWAAAIIRVCFAAVSLALCLIICRAAFYRAGFRAFTTANSTMTK